MNEMNCQRQVVLAAKTSFTFDKQTAEHASHNFFCYMHRSDCICIYASVYCAVCVCLHGIALHELQCGGKKMYISILENGLI